jgi:rhodanese-related sulfurtransferase
MIKDKLQQNIFFVINLLTERVANLEATILRTQEKHEQELSVMRNHILRMKNKEEISDDFILHGRPYNEMAPDKAYKVYNQEKFDFIMLDVSEKTFKPYKELSEAIKIPLEEISMRIKELPNKSTPILVISEDGTRSVLACEKLVSLGFFNTNNISGGYKFWPGFRMKEIQEESA